jgi:hypothetical protein
MVGFFLRALSLYYSMNDVLVLPDFFNALNGLFEGLNGPIPGYVSGEKTRYSLTK